MSRGGRRGNTEPTKGTVSGTALRDQYSNLVAGEFNASTKKPLGYSDPNPSKIRTPTLDPRAPQLSQADTRAAYDRSVAMQNSQGRGVANALAPTVAQQPAMPSMMPGAIPGASLANAGSRMAASQPAPSMAPGRVGSPMWSIPESAPAMAPTRQPGQSISPTQIAANQARRNGTPTMGRTLSASEGVKAFGGSQTPIAVTTKPNGQRMIAGQYGSGSTVSPSMLAKAPAAGRNVSAGRPTMEPTIVTNGKQPTEPRRTKQRTASL